MDILRFQRIIALLNLAYLHLKRQPTAEREQLDALLHAAHLCCQNLMEIEEHIEEISGQTDEFLRHHSEDFISAGFGEFAEQEREALLQAGLDPALVERTLQDAEENFGQAAPADFRNIRREDIEILRVTACEIEAQLQANIQARDARNTRRKLFGIVKAITGLVVIGIDPICAFKGVIPPDMAISSIMSGGGLFWTGVQEARAD